MSSKHSWAYEKRSHKRSDGSSRGSERERDYKRDEFRKERDRRRSHHESRVKSDRYEDYNSRYKVHDQPRRSLSQDGKKEMSSRNSLIESGFNNSPQSTPSPSTLPLGQICANSYSPLVSNSPQIESRTFDPRIVTKKVIEESKQNFRLLIDPAIKKGHMKVIRYNGVLPGQPPVIPKDPRRHKSKVWTMEVCDLPLPDLKVDKNYVGPMPQNTIRFSGLNDNIDRKFLHELCESYGDIIEYKVYFDPKTNRHTGTGKVIFDDKTDIKKVVDALNGRQVMGKVIKVWIEIKPPPGYAMWCQLEMECQKMRSTLTNSFSRHTSESSYQATPRTPNISSMHRNQPIASSSKSKHSKTVPSFYKNCETPPPPPPLPKQNKSSSYNSPASNLLKYDDISPTENSKFSFKNGRHTPSVDLIKNNCRSQSPFMSPVTQNKNIISKSYSPVSDPQTPQSPFKDLTPSEFYNNKLTDNYKPESVSTSKKSSDDEDDDMSLSSISSNEDRKVELNVKNVKHSKLSRPLIHPHPLTQLHSLPPSHPLPQPCLLTQPHPLTQGNVSLTGTIRPTHIYQYPPNNVQTQLNYYTLLAHPLQTRQQGPPPNGPQMEFLVRQSSFVPLNSQPSFSPYQNPQIVRTALIPIVPSNHNIPIQHHQISLTPDHIQNVLSVADSTANIHSTGSVSENIVPPANIPYTSDELLLAFQVKTGCARDLSIELKSILLKDTLKKLVEQSAFSAFENWWSKQVLNHNKNTEVLSETSSTTTRSLSEEKQNALLNQQETTKEPSTISALLQTLFGFDKNNDNRPPSSNFLSSFRITRKPHLQPTSLKSSQATRKRSSWSSIHGSHVKQRRLEESEDEPMDTVSDDEGEDEEKIDDEFEQLALRQRQVCRSGSSLYQKIYSDDSEDESDAESKSENEDMDEKMSSDSSSKSSTEESSSEFSESSEEEYTEAELTENKKVLVESKEKNIRKNQKSSTAKKDIELDSKVMFRSMYDEPRRRNANKYMDQKARNKSIILSKPEKESSASSTDTGDESSHENNKEFNTISDILIKETEIQTENLLKKLIWLEHNYFTIPPSLSSPPSSPLPQPKSSTTNRRSFMNKALSENEHKKFTMRSSKDEKLLIWDILKQGIDAEDLLYLKEAFESLQQVDAFEVKNLRWCEHPITITSPQKYKRNESKLRIHKSGCARTEGFYKIPIVEKAQYLKSALRQLNAKHQSDIQMQQISDQAGTEHKIKSRQKRAVQRRLASSIAQEEFSSLINYNNKLMRRKKALRFSKSSIHNWGLFACEPINADEMVCEYVGQMVRSIVAEIRERRYEKQGIGSSYLFRLDSDSVIDATKDGCNARFINHCCDPNCYAKVILVEGAKKIVIYSRRAIKLGEEITYDYKFPIEDEKIPCLCGAALCRGTLN
ncbi:histone-lysine N-methyltransferase SETD1B isoform X1 [Hydra vulgaris]|uniref:histone-lysine N-methyltransferase SETD1B isoform X1 n=1 Tax=Hydra vulgaris TaxID=6087 RepID=UPI001F5E4AF7|nr:histone-lysine N-methyltransferase SETD1B [Hydra vulgaris]